MKRTIRILCATLFMFVALALIITACGGGSGSGSGSSSNASHFAVFNSNPLGLHLRSASQAARAGIASEFAVNAQGTTTTTVTSNLTGWCASFGVGGIPEGARAAASLFALGRFQDGNCDDKTVADSSAGVVIPTNGQIGNLVCDAVGTGTAADSGQIPVKIIHADGSETVTALTCTFGVSSGGKVHSEDKSTADRVNVVAGDQVAARLFINHGDVYTVIRVSMDYAVPNF